MATLAEKQAELTEARAALSAARIRGGYSQGDRSFQSSPFRDLEANVSRLAREVDELTALANGARNPLVVTASYR